MASNLRLGFRESQHKHLLESIVVNPSLSKKSSSKTCLRSFVHASTADYCCGRHLGAEWETSLYWRHFLSWDEKTFCHPRELQQGIIHVHEFSSSSSKVSLCPQVGGDIWAMSRISSFIERAPPVQNMGVFFPATQRIPIEIEENPSRSFMAQLSYSTVDIAIARILHM